MRHISAIDYKKYLDSANSKIDTWLGKSGLLKRKVPIPIFEAELSHFIQEFLINYSSGITLDKALTLTLGAQCNDALLSRQLTLSNSAIQALNHYAALQDRKEIWRFVRLINQFQITGSQSTIAALEKYHDELWQMKLIQVRKKSEVVTLKLTFLLMLSLISVIITVITPIVLLL